MIQADAPNQEQLTAKASASAAEAGRRETSVSLKQQGSPPLSSGGSMVLPTHPKQPILVWPGKAADWQAEETRKELRAREVGAAYYEGWAVSRLLLNEATGLSQDMGRKNVFLASAGWVGRK